MNDILNNLTSLKKQIHQFEINYHRDPNSIKLLCVTKKQSIENIQQAIQSGQTSFGENYLQEALPKITHFEEKGLPLEWHFIGPIQSNKTKKIAEHFSWVQSVDSLKIAQRLNKQRGAQQAPLNICLQVNISRETTKSGIMPEDLLALAEACAAMPRLKLRGLMAIPAYQADVAAQRIVFKQLKLLYDALCNKGFLLDTLSMGMSDDFEAAIAEGTTMLRIGTAIFGERS